MSEADLRRTIVDDCNNDEIVCTMIFKKKAIYKDPERIEIFERMLHSDTIPHEQLLMMVPLAKKIWFDE